MVAHQRPESHENTHGDAVYDRPIFLGDTRAHSFPAQPDGHSACLFRKRDAIPYTRRQTAMAQENAPNSSSPVATATS
ncbi:hypothetical protein PL81_17975, partial [Streptomyces sp. RSD-27]